MRLGHEGQSILEFDFSLAILMLLILLLVPNGDGIDWIALWGVLYALILWLFILFELKVDIHVLDRGLVDNLS